MEEKKKVEVKFNTREFPKIISDLREKKIKYKIYGKMLKNGQAEYRAVYYV